MTGIGTVLLDLDGVLMDHRGAAVRGLRAWLGDRATPAFVSAWFAAEDRRVAEWRSGASTWQGQRRDRLRDVLPLIDEEVGTSERLDAVFERYLAGYRASWRAFDDAAPGLVALRASGLRLAVLTNGAERQQHDKLAAIGLRDLVGPVFTAEALGVAKPDARAFHLACARLGVPSAEVLYVGDEHEVDVLGARAAGLHAVLLDRSGTAPQDEQAVITTLADVPRGFISKDQRRRPWI